MRPTHCMLMTSLSLLVPNGIHAAPVGKSSSPTSPSGKKVPAPGKQVATSRLSKTADFFAHGLSVGMELRF